MPGDATDSGGHSGAATDDGGSAFRRRPNPQDPMPRTHAMTASTRLVLGLLLLAVPVAAAAQGTAPGQGVNTPIPQGTPPDQPPAPAPGTLSDGRPKEDPGGGAANTAPGTTSSLPLPPPGQANPPDKQ